ncbi:MAG: hypothetical protein Kow0037_10910 [Calditrichia bacterium]
MDTFFSTILKRLNGKKLETSWGPRPYITLTFAQSLDGSISIVPSESVALSNREALKMTHRLRASHDAILIGIGTLLADDPRLTVRLVDGEDPQPIVVDSHLRIPLTARLLKNAKKPWIASTGDGLPGKAEQLKAAGAEVFEFSALPNGWVNLPEMLARLYQLGIRHLMVEGGARIIYSFLKEQLADQMVITVAPLLLGGFRAVKNPELANGHPWKHLANVEYCQLENNLVLRGDVMRENG